MKRNEEKNKTALSGDLIYPDGIINENESIEKIFKLDKNFFQSYNFRQSLSYLLK